MTGGHLLVGTTLKARHDETLEVETPYLRNPNHGIDGKFIERSVGDVNFEERVLKSRGIERH
jgi:hypothetical protein